MIILVALYVFILSIKIYMCVTLTMNCRNIIAETFMLHLAFVLILLHVMSADISKRSLQYYLLFTALTMLLIFTDLRQFNCDISCNHTLGFLLSSCSRRQGFRFNLYEVSVTDTDVCLPPN